jgi:hypothetical protein
MNIVHLYIRSAKLTGKVEVVGSLDLGSGLGHGLSRLEVGKLDLECNKVKLRLVFAKCA